MMTVDLFCPAKVHFLLHISRSKPVSYFVNKYHLDHLHQGHMSHIDYTIFDTQLNRQLMRWPSMLVFGKLL